MVCLKLINLNILISYFIFSASAKWLGMVSLVVLTLQNATLGISMSYARRREGDMFLSSSGLAFRNLFSDHFLTYFNFHFSRSLSGSGEIDHLPDIGI
jgi:hypothetical protein